MKNSNDIIGNRTRDLPACRAVSQPTAPPRAPIYYTNRPFTAIPTFFRFICNQLTPLFPCLYVLLRDGIGQSEYRLGYMLGNERTVSTFGRDKRIFSSAKRRNRLSGQPRLLFGGYQRTLFGWSRCSGVKMSAHRYLAPSLRISGAILQLPHMPSWHPHGQLYLCIVFYYGEPWENHEHQEYRHRRASCHPARCLSWFLEEYEKVQVSQRLK